MAVGLARAKLEVLLPTEQPFRNKRAERFQRHPAVIFFAVSSCCCSAFSDAARAVTEDVEEGHRTETVLARRCDARLGCSEKASGCKGEVSGGS